MEASANLADASMLMRKIGFIVVLLRGLLWLAAVFLICYAAETPVSGRWFSSGFFTRKASRLQKNREM